MIRKYILILSVSICLSIQSQGQISPNSLWMWMNGDSTGNVKTVFGTQGTPSPANKPGGRYGSISWTDRSGNLWMFGGESDTSGLTPIKKWNDLWKYDPLRNQWTWMKGNSLSNWTSGSGSPGSRSGSAAWTDASGDF